MPKSRGRKVNRSSATGKFVSKLAAKLSPATTVTQTIQDRDEIIADIMVELQANPRAVAHLLFNMKAEHRIMAINIMDKALEDRLTKMMKAEIQATMARGREDSPFGGRDATPAVPGTTVQADDEDAIAMHPDTPIGEVPSAESVTSAIDEAAANDAEEGPAKLRERWESRETRVGGIELFFDGQPVTEQEKLELAALREAHYESEAHRVGRVPFDTDGMMNAIRAIDRVFHAPAGAAIDIHDGKLSLQEALIAAGVDQSHYEAVVGMRQASKAE